MKEFRNTPQVHYSNLRLWINAGTSLPECKAHAKLLDMDASRWEQTRDKARVTVQALPTDYRQGCPMSNSPNLDTMTREDLLTFWNSTDKNPVRTARELFPAQYPNYVRATKQLGHYAANKAAAMLCRETGDIQGALMYEGICERIYKTLPTYAKW